MRKIALDFLLNIIASATPVFILQLYVLPKLSIQLGSNDYGILITIISLCNIVPVTFGTMLNNVRLLTEKDFKTDTSRGDFQFLLIILIVISSLILVPSIYIINPSYSLYRIFTITLMSVLFLVREYYIVSYRISLNYKNIVYNSLFLSLGYLLGIPMFIASLNWEYVYITGNALAIIHLALSSELVYESICKTNQFYKIEKDTAILIFSAISSKIINYSDKILLYPLMGGTMVSVYYVSNLLGKTVSLGISPLTSVALSYLSKIEKRPSRIFKQALLYGFIISSFGYIVSIVVSPSILYFLYPSLADMALKYIYINYASIAVSIIASIISPFILCFCDIKWQMVLNIIPSVIYIICSMFLLQKMGLYGFCLGILIANIVKLMISLLLYFYKNKDIS